MKTVKVVCAMVAVFACFCGQIWADEAMNDQPKISADAGKIVWKFKTDGQIISSPALGFDGTIYFGSRDSCFYAVNPDGTQKWKFRADGEIISSPTIDKDGMVYFINSPGIEGKGSSYVYVISPAGQLKFRYLVGKYYASPSLNPQNLLCICSFSSEDFSGMDTATGQTVWTVKILPHTYVSGSGFLPTGPNGDIYLNGYAFGDDQSVKMVTGLWCFDKNSRKQWLFEIPRGILPDGKTDFSNEIFGSPAIDTDGNLYFGVVGNDFYAINKEGKLIWKRIFGLRINFPYGVGCSPVLSSADDALYFSNMYGEVIALKMSTGEDIWKADLKSYAVASPLLGKSKTLYVGVRGGKFSAINAMNGNIKWEIMAGRGVSSSAVIDPKGILYIGALDSCLYAIDSGGDELAKTPWPMFGRDPQHTARADQVVISGVLEEKKPVEFSLGNAYPNPFNVKTVIPYSVAEKGDIEIIVYNSAGQKTDVILSGRAEPGSHSVVWDASGYSSGMYFYSMRTGSGGLLAKKVVLMK